ncbi:hypothetical protein IU405_07210 [Polaribacter sp. BAL334]|uniref:YHS domain-containing (seleno)protein n=1 Tax=Polaribacter sp. BAL334 TaxID=1708178 RepID=UPI0018D24196|nr:YHS domain-containing (seleno)protein [Polaribacter sp. BAL334]MBG7612034.1 hypothetical protein [Polaribacter sp. BAL334]
MKLLSTIFLIVISISVKAQSTEFNTKKGYVAEGYDVVSYFNEKTPIVGNKKYQTTFEKATFKFASAKNLEIFKANPLKYIPQYGGFCAYAVAAKNTKMDIDADSYEIRDGKLYLFYSSWFGNKLEDWQKEDTKKLQQLGDKNWEFLKQKNN